MTFKEKRERFDAKHPAIAEKYRRKRQHVRLLRTTHGMERADYEMLLRVQKGRCAICARTPKEAKAVHLAVDHCHDTGRVRGLLCSRCNLKVGAVKEDPARAGRTSAPYRDALVAYIVTRCVVTRRAGCL